MYKGKKQGITSLLVIFILAVLASACQKQDENINGTIADFYPFEANTFYDYAGNNVFAQQQIYYTYIDGNRAQRRLTAVNDTELTEVFELKDGELWLIFGDTEGYHYESLLDKTEEELMSYLDPMYSGFTKRLILQEPLTLGHSWSLDGVATCEVTNENAEVVTPYGTFEALEVTTTDIAETQGSGYTKKDYYAIGIGLVKTEYTNNTNQVTELPLVSIETDSAVSKEIRIDVPDVVNGQLNTLYTQMMIKTNDDFYATISEVLQRRPDADYEPLLPANAVVQSIELTREGYYLKLDLSKEFYSRDLGGGIEGMMLQGLANTLGDLYGMEKVEITVDGQPYTSSHIEKQAGEFYTVER